MNEFCLPTRWARDRAAKQLEDRCQRKAKVVLALTIILVGLLGFGAGIAVASGWTLQ